MPEVGLETVATVFGNSEQGLAPKIPEDAFNRLKEMMGTLKMGSEMGPLVKEEYVKLLNSPANRARRERGEQVWVPLTYALQGQFMNQVFGSKAHPFIVFPLSVSGRPTKKEDEKRGTSYTVRMDVLARSRDPKAQFEGPAGVSIYSFPTEADAQRFIDNVRSKQYYHANLRISERSATGTLGLGQTGILSGNFNEPFQPAGNLENGHSWADPYGRAASCYPPSTLREVLLCKEDYREFLVDAMVQRGNINSKKDGTSAVLTVYDPSIASDATMLESLKGGVSIWLSRDDFTLARLGTGSTIRTLVQVGKEKPVKDAKSNNPTGEMRRMYSAKWVQVLFDAGEGNGQMPTPTAVAGVLPNNPNKPATRDF